MYCHVSTVNSSTRYAFTFDKNAQCVFVVNSAGVIYIDKQGKMPSSFICKALNEVTAHTIKKGLAPKINITNAATYLQGIAKSCNYKKLPSQGVSFSVWIYPQKNAL